MRYFAKDENIKKLIHANRVVIMQFGNNSCAPCAAVMAKLEAWRKKHSEVPMYYIPVEEFPNLSAQHGIFFIPAVCLYIDGKCALKIAGYFSLEEFLKKTERYLSIMQNQ